MANDYKIRLGADVTGLNKEITANLKKQEYKVKITADGKSVQQLTKRVSETTSASGKLLTITERLNQTTGKWKTTINETTPKVKQLATETKNASTHVQSLGDVFQKVLKFGGVAEALYLVRDAMKEVVQQTLEYDQALTEFKKVSSLSGDELDNYTQKLGELGEAVSRTRKEMVEASTAFLKSGYSEDQAMALSQISEMYKNVADDVNMTSEESANFIISQQKAFGDTSEYFAKHSIDAINNISNNMAVSSSDVSTALSKTSSAMAALGNTYDQTSALVAAGSEIMVGQSSKVARGLRTIGNNIANLAQENDTLEISVGGVVKSISLIDQATGDMRSTYDILADISTEWDKMSNSEKQAIAIQTAGKNQFEVYTSVLSNFAGAQKALTLAQESAGSAAKENERYMESLGAKLNNVKAQLQELVLGNGGFSKFLKVLLDCTTGLLKFTNSGLGQAIIKAGAFVVVMTNLGKAMALVKGLGIIEWFKDFVLAIEVATTSVGGLNVALQTLNINPVILGITAVVGAVVAAAEAVKYLASSEERAYSHLEESINNIVDLEEKLQELKATDNGSAAMEEEIALTEKQIELNKQLLQQEYEKAAAKNAKRNDKEQDYVNYRGGAVAFNKDFVQNDIGVALAVSTETNSIYTAIDAYNALDEAKGGSIERNEEIVAKITELNAYFDAERARLVELEEQGIQLTESDKKELEAINALADSMAKETEESDASADSVEAQVDAMEEAAAEADKLAKANQDMANTLKEVESGYDTLNQYIEEYNAGQGISMDTLTSLTSLSEGYVACLEYENGQVSLNQEAYDALAQSQIDDAEALLFLESQSQLAALAQGGLNDTLEAGVLASADADVAMQNAATQAVLAAGQAESAAEGWNKYWTALANGNSTAAYKKNKSEYERIERETKAKYEAYEAARQNIGKNGKGSKSGGGGSSKEKDAWLEEYNEKVKQLDRLHDLQLISDKDYYDQLNSLAQEYLANREKYEDEYGKAVKKVYDGFKKLLQDNIKDQKDAIKKLKEDKIKSIEKEIDATKKARDEEEKYWDAKIDAFKRQREELEHQNQLMEYQEALEKARANKVMLIGEDGKWTYGQDESAVSDAEQQLADYEDEYRYQQQLAALEQSRDNALAVYDEKLANLEAYKDKTTEYYDQMLEDYELRAEALLENQLTEVDNENAMWTTRLENVAAFVNEYNELMSQLGGGRVEVSYQGLTRADVGVVNYGKHANGASSIRDEDISIVGDDPHKEVVIGRKLNNGVAMHLPNGTGVVNAQGTRTLAGMLNALGQSGSNFGAGVGSMINNTSSAKNISIGEINLPNVSNGQDFVNYLQNFSMDMTQMAF